MYGKITKTQNSYFYTPRNQQSPANSEEMLIILSIAVGFACTSIIMFAFQALGLSIWAFFHGGGFLVCVAGASVAAYKALGHLRWFRDKVP